MIHFLSKKQSQQYGSIKRHSTADGFVLRPWCNLCPYAEIAACHCYTIFLCACIITDFECENQQPSLNTFTSFQPIPSFHNLLQSLITFSQPILFLHSLFTPSHHQNPPKPSREKGKSIAVMSRKTSRFKRQLLVNQVGSVNFQRYFFPLDGGGGVLI